MRKLTMFITAVFVVFLINYIILFRARLHTFLRGGGLIYLVLDNGKLLQETQLTPVSLYIRSAARTISRASYFFIWFLMTPDRIWLFKEQITAASWNVVLWLLRYYFHYYCYLNCFYLYLYHHHHHHHHYHHYTIFTWDWSASEFYNTTTAHPEISMVSLGPSTRGSDSRPVLYRATTADPATSIVSLGPATRGSDSRPFMYSATTADPETSIVSLGPTTHGSDSRPDLYCTATPHTKCRVVSCSSTSSAKKSMLPAFCCHVI